MDPIALGLAVSSAGLHAGWNLAAKRVSGDFGVLWAGLVLAAVLGAPVLLLLGAPTGLGAVVPWLAATGVFHAAYFWLLGRSYERGEISVVYPVARGTSIAAVTVLAALLGEPPSAGGAVGIAAVCAGLGVLAWPGLRDEHGRASLLAAAGSGLALAGGLLVDKTASRACHPYAYDWGLFVATALALGPLAFLRREACASAFRERWRFAAWIGPGSLTAYLLVLFAYRLAPVSYVVAARECSVALGALLGVAVLGERVTAFKVAGLAAVAAGLALLRLA